MGSERTYQELALLPPPLELVETLTTLRAANRATRMLAELKGMANLIPNQYILINSLTIRESQDSSEIENIITSQDELFKAITSDEFKAPTPAKEVVNYRQALYRGSELINQQGFLKVNDIIDIQRIIIQNEAGIRSTPGTVLKYDKTGQVVYVPPQDKDEIHRLLSNFIEHFNAPLQDSPNVLVQMAILHFQFESIHPFYDGNGRTGRILNLLFLLLHKRLDIPILYLSSYINSMKQDYYRLLNHTNTSYEWEQWIVYMLGAIEHTAKETIQKVKAITNLLQTTADQVRELAPKIYSRELVELLFEHPYSKIDYVVTALDVERKAASRYLKKLQEIGVLRSEKVGREVIYINEQFMNLLAV